MNNGFRVFAVAAILGVAAMQPAGAQGVLAGVSGALNVEVGDNVMPAGRYGCTERIAKQVDGYWEYDIQGRGFIRLMDDGRYADPYDALGTYSHASDSTVFSGAFLDGAYAERIETDESEHRFRLVIPVDGDEDRWLCDLEEE